MNLNELKEESYSFTQLASDQVRNLAFAGIGIIWIFKNDNSQIGMIPEALLWPLVFLTITLALDLLQYLIPACIYSYLFYKKEKEMEGNPKTNFSLPFRNSIPGWICFYGKCLSLVLSYFFIVSFLFNKI